MNLKGIIVSCLMALTTLTAGAQKVITFETRDAKLSHGHSFSRADGKNSLTVGLLSWFNGYVPVYYERAVLSMVSVQFGAGLTVRSFGNDLGYAISGEGETSDLFGRTTGIDVVDNYSHYKYRTTQPGLYLSFAPKVYYDDDVMDGLYVSPMIEYKMFRYSARKADETAPVSGITDDDLQIPRSSSIMTEHMNCIDATVNFGGHFMARNHVTFGWSTGFGIRSSSSQRLDIGIYSDAQGNGHYGNAVAEYNKTKFLFTFNFVVGGWF